MISALVQHNQLRRALELFCEMHKLSESTDEFSASSVIKAVTAWVNIEQGKIVHAHVMKMGLENKLFVGSALIDMYSKCGVIKDAYNIFCSLPEKNDVSWNSMIMGFAQNGFSSDALMIYQEMNEYGVSPTAVTFVGILLACTHTGLVEDGKQYYRPRNFSFAHHLRKNLGYGSPSFLVVKLLSNIAAAKQLWSDVGRTRDSMKAIGVVKEPGRGDCSPWKPHRCIPVDMHANSYSSVSSALMSLTKMSWWPVSVGAAKQGSSEALLVYTRRRSWSKMKKNPEETECGTDHRSHWHIEQQPSLDPFTLKGPPLCMKALRSLHAALALHNFNCTLEDIGG
ncbi:Pentatricopeptide repeat-containing protein [Drosera capensis]